jgi:hypothetical protein
MAKRSRCATYGSTETTAVAPSLREAETYRFDGGITAHDRHKGEGGGATVDSFTYEIDIRDASDDLVAHVAFRWHYWRMGS